MRDLAGTIGTSGTTGRADPAGGLGGELAASLDVGEVADRTLAALEAIPGVEAVAARDTCHERQRGHGARGSRPRTDRGAGQRQPACGRGLLSLPNRRRRGGGGAPALRDRRAAARRRPAGGVHERFHPRVRTRPDRGRAGGGGARGLPRRPGPRERAPLRRGAGARRPGCPDRAPQPPLLPRAARPGSRPRAALRTGAGADRDRPRRLQGRQRQGRPPGGRCRPVRGVGADAHGRPERGHRLPVGGDEFAIILPESSAADAELLAGRIARAIGSRPILNAGALLLSAGAAELRPADRPTDLFERADEALYRAKELGKARTVLANDA